MKNLKILTAVIAIAFLSLSFTNRTETKAALHQQIVKLIGDTMSEKIGNDNVKAEIVVTLNDKSELVVISVKSDNSYIDRFVKSKLNYKKITVKDLNPGEIYRVPLTIVNE